MKFLHGRLRRLPFSVAAGFYAWMTWHDTWRRHCASLADHFPPPAPLPLRVLDLGIGPGISGIGILDRRPDVDIVGVDFSARMLHRAVHFTRAAGAPIALVRADGHHLPFADASFDVVTHHSFLYLVQDRHAVLDEIHRVLRPGGRYVLLEPSADGRLSSVPGMGGHFRFRLSMFLWRIASGAYGRFSRGGLADLLGAHGFTSVAVGETLSGLGLLGTATKGSPAAAR